MASILATAAGRPGTAPSTVRAPATRAVAAWLFACCALVFAMVVVGGVTRLTHSGLSITEWQPIVGTVPPLTDADWASAFERYRATPEYRQVNHAMTLAEFKGIFWWEYAHRLLGRLIGVAFLVPFAWFAVRRRIPPGYAWPLAGIFVLGGLQGAAGWYMVRSGLVDDPRVSQFRLTLHLVLAFLIFAAMLWTALRLRAPATARDARSPALRRAARHALVFVALVLLMVASGGLVAGIRAGFAYNTFPLMNGSLVPPEVLMLEPAWRNFFWNMATVQLDHRALAVVLVVAVAWLWMRVRAAPDATPAARRAVHAVAAMLAIQASLGIATVVNVVPLALAALHQAGAVLLFGLALVLAHALRRGAAIALTAPNGEHARSSLVPPEPDHGRHPRT
jgi:cytochrome c oxidase assembly protein subunit 15